MAAKVFGKPGLCASLVSFTPIQEISRYHAPYLRANILRKKEAFREGGIAALANTASGGRDLTTLLSESRTSSVIATC